MTLFSFRCTPLDKAVSAGTIKEINRILKNKSALQKVASERMEYLIYVAAKAGHLDVLDILLKAKSSSGAAGVPGGITLAAAASEGQEEALQVLLDHGANIDARDEFGVTALMTAVKYNNKSCTDFLLTKGADASLRDNRGRTAMYLVAELGYLGVLKYLFGHEVEIDTPDDEGITPLMAAVKNYNMGCAKLLVNRGASASIKDFFLAMTYNVAQYNVDSINLLLTRIRAQGWSIDWQDETGQTALMCSVRAANIGAVKLLLEQGADVRVQDNRGKNALSIAYELHNSATEKFRTDGPMDETVVDQRFVTIDKIQRLVFTRGELDKIEFSLFDIYVVMGFSVFLA